MGVVDRRLVDLQRVEESLPRAQNQLEVFSLLFARERLVEDLQASPPLCSEEIERIARGWIYKEPRVAQV